MFSVLVIERVNNLYCLITQNQIHKGFDSINARNIHLIVKYCIKYIFKIF